jgi:hypothetical protein
VGSWPRKELLEQVDLFGWHLIYCPKNFLGFLVIDSGPRELTLDINDRLLMIKLLAHLLFKSVGQPAERVRYLACQFVQSGLRLWAGITSACFCQVIPSPYNFQVLRVLAKGSPLFESDVPRTSLSTDSYE